MITALPAHLEYGKKYTVMSDFGTIAKHGFTERSVIIIQFREVEYKGQKYVQVNTVKRIDLKRVGIGDISYGNEFGGMQSGHPFDVQHYIDML